jgi:hypothetical protein
MKTIKAWPGRAGLAVALCIGLVLAIGLPARADSIGEERSVYERLENGEEISLHLDEVLRRGRLAFEAQWTPAEGGGRPMTTGTGGALANGASPLHFPRNFNRVSAQDSNGCAGCHNAPFGIPGGGGDFVTGVFVAAQRFDFATFDHSDGVVTGGAMHEDGSFATLGDIGNYRATVGMFGSGFIEMLARQMTSDLQAIRDGLAPGESAALTSKGVDFGVLQRTGDGSWDTSGVEGLPPQSLASSGALPSLIIHPFHQSGSVVSIRQFTNNAFNHHHGMQSAERFGDGVDADGDGYVNELTVADITATTLYQATLPVPQQVMPKDPKVRRAIRQGEALFNDIGCADCHIPALPLTDEGWIYTEPNPYNPPGNLQAGEGASLAVDLTHSGLPGQRPKPKNGVLWVRAFTDLKLHDITSGPDDPNAEAININHPGGSPEFLGGNTEFLTKKLWGAANERPYFHHGKFTTLRDATLAHDGEAVDARAAFEDLDAGEQDQVIEFLKSLQVVNPNGRR